MVSPAFIAMATSGLDLLYCAQYGPFKTFRVNLEEFRTLKLFDKDPLFSKYGSTEWIVFQSKSFSERMAFQSESLRECLLVSVGVDCAAC